jgi:hypothetical protein
MAGAKADENAAFNNMMEEAADRMVQIVFMSGELG